MIKLTPTQQVLVDDLQGDGRYLLYHQPKLSLSQPYAVISQLYYPYNSPCYFTIRLTSLEAVHQLIEQGLVVEVEQTPVFGGTRVIYQLNKEALNELKTSI